MDNHNKIPQILRIVFHIIVVSILTLLIITIIKSGGETSRSAIISGFGTVASIYGIIIALFQIGQAKNAAEAAESAATKRSKDIKEFMSFADINRHIEITNTIPTFLSAKQYEAAIIKIDQLKELLVELNEHGGLNDEERKTASSYIIKLGTDILNIRKHMNGQNILEEDVVIAHIVNTNTYLQEISAKLKKNNYDTREV